MLLLGGSLDWCYSWSQMGVNYPEGDGMAQRPEHSFGTDIKRPVVGGGGSSLVVQWLKLHVPNSGGPGSTPGQESRSHMPQLKTPHAAMKTDNLVCHN